MRITCYHTLPHITAICITTTWSWHSNLLAFPYPRNYITADVSVVIYSRRIRPLLPTHLQTIITVIVWSATANGNHLSSATSQWTTVGGVVGLRSSTPGHNGFCGVTFALIQHNPLDIHVHVNVSLPNHTTIYHRVCIVFDTMYTLMYALTHWLSAPLDTG